MGPLCDSKLIIIHYVLEIYRLSYLFFNDILSAPEPKCHNAKMHKVSMLVLYRGVTVDQNRDADHQNNYIILWNSMTLTSFVFTELANAMKYGGGEGLI